MSLTTEELSLLREEATDWRSDLCDVYRLTAADDPYGGSGDETETLVAQDLSCTVETGAGHEQLLLLFGVQREETVFIVSLPAEADVEVGDHLVVTTKDDQHMQVTAVMAPETHEIERMIIATSLAEHNE